MKSIHTAIQGKLKTEKQLNLNFSPFLARALGGLAIWKSLNISLMSLFSFSPKGSRSTKASVPTLGGSLTGPARGGISGGGLELCCPPDIRLEVGGKMLDWKGLPKVECWVQTPLEAGVLFCPQEGSCWVDVVPKSPWLAPQSCTGVVE